MKLEFEKIVYMNCGTSSTRKFSIVISEFRMGHWLVFVGEQVLANQYTGYKSLELTSRNLLRHAYQSASVGCSLLIKLNNFFFSCDTVHLNVVKNKQILGWWRRNTIEKLENWAIIVKCVLLVMHAKFRPRLQYIRILACRGQKMKSGIAGLGRMQTAVCWHWVTGQNANSCMLTLSDWTNANSCMMTLSGPLQKGVRVKTSSPSSLADDPKDVKTSSGINVKSKATPHKIKCHTCLVTLSL